MEYLFNIVYALWFLSEILINLLLRSKSVDKQGADKGSLRLIWIGIVAAITIAVFVSFNFQLTIAKNVWVQYAGLMAMIAGILLRIIALRMLGKFFTADVTIRQDHHLIKQGFYKYFRHPSYTASLITFVGFGLSLNNWLSLLIVTVTVIFVFRVRIKVEEEALIAQFGTHYLQYKQEAWGLISFIH